MPSKYPSVLGEHYFRRFKTLYNLHNTFVYKQYKMVSNIVPAKWKEQKLTFHYKQYKMVSYIILAK